VAIIAGIVAVAVAASPLIIKRLQGADPNSVKFRIQWMEAARAMIYDNPVFGAGLNSYVYAQVPYGNFKTPGEMTNFYGEIWPVVHNSWMIVWSEQGTIGFLLWIAFHFAVIAVGIRNLRIKDPLMHALSAGLVAGFIAIMIDGLASFYVRQEAPARTFWIATALILAIGHWRRTNEQAAAAPFEAPAMPEPRNPGSRPASEGRWLPSRQSLLR